MLVADIYIYISMLFLLIVDYKHERELSCVWLFVTPWTVACQAPLSMEFSRQDYWSVLPFPSTGIPHTLLYCTLHILHFFLQIEDLWQSYIRQAHQDHFPTAFSHFLSFVSHFSNSQNISNFFIIITFVMVICHQWSLMLLLWKTLLLTESSDDD